jgi:two-component system OmpR family sensor kinase
MWNRTQHQLAFSLLCGYPMAQLIGQALAPVLVEACAQHSAVVPAESYTTLEHETDRLRAIAALQQKAASLEQALEAERSARDQAEAALRAREEFMSIASHELRTPISVLTAQAQLSLRRFERTGELDAERVARALRTIGSQADKLTRLVSQLLDISRLDAATLTIDPQPTDLVALVEQVVAGSLSVTHQHTISLRAPSYLECHVDGLRLEQVLTNLIDNAIKYSPDGGPVEVELSQPTLDSVMVSIRDRGLGIAPEKRERIFERFFQAHANAYRSGMGLGLYVSRHIVELHGGQIRAEFPPDGGTRMVVCLPNVPASERATVAAD